MKVENGITRNNKVKMTLFSGLACKATFLPESSSRMGPAPIRRINQRKSLDLFDCHSFFDQNANQLQPIMLLIIFCNLVVQSRPNSC